jgi:O-antigen ligase
MTLAPARSWMPAAPVVVASQGVLPAWPVTALLLLYPAWWALGMGVLVFPLTAAVMARHLWGRRHAVALPPGFGLWLLFLTVAVASVAALGADPAGTVPGTAGSRLVGVLYRLTMYASLTVLLVYLGNARMAQRKLVGLLAWLFVVTVAGGLLGTFAGDFAFASPVELVLPPHIRSTGFVQSLVHPSAAQVMDLLGDAKPRPAAPWGYTNTWGNNVCLLVGWFVVAPGLRRPMWTVLGLALATVPVVYSLNRGLWIGLGVIAVCVAVRLAARGRLAALSGIGVAAVLVGVALAVTPLGDVVQQRLDAGRSNGVRLYLTEQAVAGLRESPLIGFGSTRNTQGGRNSITVGESADCERCGNFTVGGNGQFWQLLFAHGLLGTAAYLGFFAYGLWRFRRDASPVGLVGSAAIASTFASMFWYNALVTPLAFTFCAYALLWRNERVSSS